jgi:hypothetical protein
MKLVEAPSGMIVDVDNPEVAQCRICTEWYWKEWIKGYCRPCWRDYHWWRHSRQALEKKGAPVQDLSVHRFRELYMAGLLERVPWTWPGETEIPPGVYDPGL